MTELRPLEMIPVIPPFKLEQFLPLARPWIEKGCKWAPEWDVADIEGALRAKIFTLWVAWEKSNEKEPCAGALVIRVSRWKNGDLVAHDVVFAARDRRRVLPLLDRLEEFYAERGCKRFRFIAGRNGWERVLPTYRPVGVVLEKVLQS